MEAVPRLFMISCELKVSPSNTEFGPTLKKYIKDHYHEDPEQYVKEIKELETLRQTAIKAPMDFTGCSILKRYYSQLHMLQSRFPMTDDGAACVPFMWTDIYSGVAYNITDIEYEEACILYNIGALHSKLGTMDSRINAEGMKIGCTHFQCAAWAFQHLRDTYPQPKGSDMSHDLLSFFINVMLAQAQECILEKSMLDSRKSSITAKIAAQVVDYYKCALSKMVKGSSPSSDGFFYIVGSKTFTGWKKSIEFKVSYYMSISHLFMGNQSEEHEKWGERVAWFHSAYEHLMEAIKIAKNIGRDDLNEPLNFVMDVIGGKHSTSKRENEFVYHEKVPQTDSLLELKGASLVKGIPFSPSDPDVSGPDIFARLVPMEAHETSSLYSEEKAKILRSVVTKIEEKNEELMAYLSSLQLDNSTSFQDEEKIPQELLEKCAAMSVQPNATSDLIELMNVLMNVSKDVEVALKSSSAILKEEEQKEQKYQETFGKRPSMIIVELTKECSKYEEAHKKAVESNNTLQAAVNIHLNNLSKLASPLEDLVKILPAVASVKTPENVKVMQEFNQLLNKVDEMRNQRQYLEQQLRDSLLDDDITKRLVTLDKKEDVQKTFAEELKKHDQLLTYLDQNLAAQDNILCALTQANARNADTRKAIVEISQQRESMVQSLINSYEAYDDLVAKAKKGLEFYQRLHANTTRLLSRIRSVTKVQDEERVQIAEAEFRKGTRLPETLGDMPEKHVPKLKDYLPYLAKREFHESPLPPGVNNFSPIQHYPSLPIQHQIIPEHLQKPALGGPSPVGFDRNLKPMSNDSHRLSEDKFDSPSMGVRPAPVGSEHTSLPTTCTSFLPSGMPDLGRIPQYVAAQQWKQPISMTSQDMAYGQYPSPNSAYTSNQPYVSPTNNASMNTQHNLIASASSQPHVSPTNNASMNTQHNLPTPQSGPKYSSAVFSAAASAATGIGNVPYQLPQQPYNHPASGMNVNPNQTFPSQATNNVHNMGQTSQHVSNVPSAVMGSFTPIPVTNVPYSSLPPHPYSSADYSTHSHSGNVIAQMDTRTNTFTSLNTNLSSNTVGSASTGTGYLPQNVQYVTVASSSGNASISSAYTSEIPNYPNSKNLQNSTGYVANSNYINNASAVQPQTTTLNSNIPLSNIASSNTQINSYIPYTSQVPTNASYSASIPTNSGAQARNYMNLQNLSFVQPRMPSQVPVHQNPNMLPVQQSSNVASVHQNPNMQPFQQNSNIASVHQNPNMQSVQQNSNVASVHQYSNAASVPQYLNAASIQQYPNSTSVQQHPNSAFVQQNQHSAFIPQNPSFISNIQNSTTVSNVSQVINQPSTAPYNYHAAGSVMNQNISLPDQQLPIPIQPKALSPSQPLQPLPPTNLDSASTVVVSNAYVPDRRPSSTPLDSKPKLSIARDFITPPPEPISARRESLTDQTDMSNQSTFQILQPKVLDLKSIVPAKEKEQAYLAKDPLDDSSVRAKFVSEVEKYEKLVDGLVRKSLNGTTPLDQKWKELTDAQDKESRKMSISVARCYPLKNRYPDVMPYDSNRVSLTSAKDDYINASYLKDICSSSPIFILTQSPLPATFNDFWLMVWEQQVETLISLLPESELKNHIYFPKEKGQTLTYGLYEISLHSYKEKTGFTERMINLTQIKNRMSRVVVHLQFTLWPASGIPSSPAPVLQFITDVLSYQKQQRNLLRPVVVHCSSGIGRSGCFCLITALVTEMNCGHGPKDVAQVATTLSQQRKFLIQDKDQLKFCYDTVLYYAQDLLMRRGILTSRASFDDKLPGSGSTNTHVRHPSEDFILGSGGLAKLQSDMAKMGLSDSSDAPKVENTKTELGSETPERGSGTPIKSAESANVLKDGVDKQDSETEEIPKQETVPADKSLNSIASLMDPSNFTLDSALPGKRRITKEAFSSSKGSLSATSTDSADPLSQLDPLWSLKK